MRSCSFARPRRTISVGVKTASVGGIRARNTGSERCALMVRSERIENFVLVGLTSVFILLTIGLGINWLTGHEAQRSLILMILGGFLLCASLIWIRHAQRRLW
jgi:hypothetical protein